MSRKVAVIGHIVPIPTSITPPPAKAWLHNYARVFVDDRTMVDHIAYLKESKGIPQGEDFSVWEMYLCSSLLLRSHLQRHGCEVHLVNYVDTDNEARVFAELKDFGPDIVVFSTTFILSTSQMIYACKVLRRHLPDAFIVAGGHHIFTTLLYMDHQQKVDYLKQTKIDAFVNDVQGEATLMSLVESYPGQLNRVPNLILKTAGDAFLETPRQIEENDINSTLVEFDGIAAGSVVHVRTARSCSFKCAFCSYPTIAGDLALMDLDNVLLTLRRAKAAGVGSIFFVDDTFNVPKPRFKTLVERMIAEKIDLPWYSFLRCAHVDEPLVKRMAQSGCKGVFLGIESGSDAVLKHMDKASTIRFYAQGIQWLKDAGITTVGAFVIGFPGETKDTVAETEAFIRNAGLDYFFMQPFYYLHHTPIHKKANQYKLEGNGLLWSHETMEWREAMDLMDGIFLRTLESGGPTAVNVDYSLWEIAFLETKGFDRSAILEYRRSINSMTAAQMARLGSRREPVALGA